jgi:predicted TIM-barrel fold metal-dependent hydrolase
VFIDIHTHCIMFHDPRQGAISDWTTPEQLISMWDEAGIAKGVVLPMVHHELTTIQTTENVLDMAAKWPDRIIPFCNLDPRYHYNTPQADFTPLLEHYKSLGCKGVGEMCANLWWDDDRVLNMLSHIEKSGLPMIFHVASADRGMYGLVEEPGLPKLEKVLQMFPKLQFIGHSMAFWSAVDGGVTEQEWMGYPKGPVRPGGRLIELFRKYDNLWGDISAGSGHNAFARDPEFGYWMMEEFQDRLLFGTDICRPGQELPQVTLLKDALAGGHISRQAYEKITHENAEKLLGL